MTYIASQELELLKNEFSSLIGLKVDWLSLPQGSLVGFEPSQIAVIVNTILDAALPQIKLLAVNPENRAKLEHIGLSKSPSLIGQRESYPDYIHKSGYRLELKGLFVDNPFLRLKRPPTRREPSARLKENVTVDNVDPQRDILMLAAAQLQEFDGICHPVIIDIGLFPMIECIRERDNRLLGAGGRWYKGIPQVIKKSSSKKYLNNQKLDDSDFEKDTNFGKLKRIPYAPLQDFLGKHS